MTPTDRTALGARRDALRAELDEAERLLGQADSNGPVSRLEVGRGNPPLLPPTQAQQDAWRAHLLAVSNTAEARRLRHEERTKWLPREWWHCGAGAKR